jgi:hypothetical protein
VIINVEVEGVALSEAATSTLSAGEFHYDVDDGTLYVRLSDDSDPANSQVFVTYRYFFASSPISLPYDLNTGAEVFYDGRLNSTSPISYALDDENIGIALETNTTVQLNNTDGFFDSIYETLFWEYKDVKIYQYSGDLSAVTEAQKIFDGTIEDKSYNYSSISFKCKDFVYKLRQELTVENFDSSDGDVADTFLDTPKRRIYGKVDNARCVPIDNVLDGYTLTGTATATTGGTTVTGTGSSYLDEVSPNDKLVVTLVTGDIVELNVVSVDSDTQITVDSDIDIGFSALAIKNVPEIPYRKKNRNWHIAGHKLRAPSTTITAVIQANRITVADVSDFEEDDRILVNGTEVATISQISSNTLILNQNLGTLPSIGQTVLKEPVSRAFIGTREIIIERDFTVSNTSTDAILQIKNTAEFNLARVKTDTTGSFTFTNASRTVSVSGIDALNILKPRDWIKPDDITYSTYYEILAVAESSITLRVAFAEATTTDGANYKNVEIINDETPVTVNCVGKELSSTWLKTAAHVVEDLITNDAGLTINQASFDAAKTANDYAMSYIVPKNIGEINVKITDVINDINSSVFGSVFLNNSLEIAYNILAPDKPSDFTLVNSDDIVGTVRIDSKNDSIRTVNARYRPFYDRFQNENTSLFYSFTNTFNTRSIGSTEDREIFIYVYDTDVAQTLAQRYAYYNSLSRSIVSFKTKLQLTTRTLNDKIKLNLRRLYTRFGGQDAQKIGSITKITKTANDTSVELNDFSNLFNRSANWSENTANAYSSADNDEKILNGYWCDSTKEVPNVASESEIGQNRWN